jgi:hypothetical protein
LTWVDVVLLDKDGSKGLYVDKYPLLDNDDRVESLLPAVGRGAFSHVDVNLGRNQV